MLPAFFGGKIINNIEYIPDFQKQKMFIASILSYQSYWCLCRYFRFKKNGI